MDPAAAIDNNQIRQMNIVVSPMQILQIGKLANQFHGQWQHAPLPRYDDDDLLQEQQQNGKETTAIHISMACCSDVVGERVEIRLKKLPQINPFCCSCCCYGEIADSNHGSEFTYSVYAAAACKNHKGRNIVQRSMCIHCRTLTFRFRLN